MQARFFFSFVIQKTSVSVLKPNVRPSAPGDVSFLYGYTFAFAELHSGQIRIALMLANSSLFGLLSSGSRTTILTGSSTPLDPEIRA